MTTIFLISTLVLLFLGIPISFTIGLASILFIMMADIQPMIIVQRLFMGATSLPLLAVPFFILAGDLMNRGGIASRLIKLANMAVGGITGGLGVVAVLSCMFFAAISGSGIATAAAIGAIIIPAMVAKGYDRSFATTIVSASSPLGIVIPPSIAIIIYGVMANTSIANLYKAGLPTGIIIGIFLILLVMFLSKRKGYTQEKVHYTWKEIITTFIGALWALGTPILLIGGVFAGIFTPTESAVVAVLYGLFVGLFIYRELKFSDLFSLFLNSARTTARIMIIISVAAIFSWVLSYQQIPQMVLGGLTAFSESKLVILLVINLILLIAGTFIEGSAIIVIATPILLPIAYTYGIDPIHLGMIIIANTAIGLMTPPFGTCLYTAASVGKAPVEQVAKHSLLFAAVMFLALLIITYFPITVMFLID